MNLGRIIFYFNTSMRTICLFSFFAVLFSLSAVAQEDSITVGIYPKYDEVGKVHRYFFGENYRKEYALQTRVPIIRLSNIHGGLKPLRRGGGFQSHSLRLEDSQGKEWVLRSVEKYPESLLPENLRETFVLDVLKDNMSAQHPFAALVVPELAEAAGVAHAKPKIGWVLADPLLGEFAPVFANTLCLLEEREPDGDSDNTLKMFRKLVEDHDNRPDGIAFLKAKALDVLIGDWDRHADQWRWRPEKENGKTVYKPIPRDRDQVFYLTQGLIPKYAQASYLLPYIQGYERNVQNINWYVWESRGISTRFLSALSEDEWNRVIREFCAAITDELLEKAVSKLPEPGYSLRHSSLIAQLKQRRATLPAMMNDYYHFLNRIVDIQGSNKAELVHLKSNADQSLTLTMQSLSKNGKLKDTLVHKTFDPALTKELRIYLHDGNDSLVLDNQSSEIAVRIIGGHGFKSYHTENAYRKVKLYDKPDSSVFTGIQNRFKLNLSADTANLSYRQTDLYHKSRYLLNAGYNNDDGILLGLSVKYMNPGFRKFPYGNTQSFSFVHSFSTQAFKFHYTGEWTRIIGKADFILQASAYAPNNTRNFFGLGNESIYDRESQAIRYYRTRFSLYQLDPALRWGRGKQIFSVGPSLQYYHFNADSQQDRFIAQTDQLHTADSLTIDKEKLFGGLKFKYTIDSRDNILIPSSGMFLDVGIQGYLGLNNYANNFGQLNASAAFYKKLDKRANFVIADRFGGTLTAGKHTFYQSAFIGGEGTLLGFRQYRFAGDHSFYNNLEMRVKLADFVSYVLPGQLGLVGFHDIGRVWRKNENSDRWHQGVGGGFYFAPASMAMIRVIAAHSKEGWYPYLALNFRY